MRAIPLIAAACMVACGCIAGCQPRQTTTAASTHSTTPTSEAHPAATLPKWAASPTRPGDDRPPVGRSLFDAATTQPKAGHRVVEIPFPFEALLQRIDERAGCSMSASCVRAVLIPLGRSLQRMTASPAFFAHPRVVVAVVAEAGPEAAGAMLLKDRLYIGYQEQAARLEVISYNPTAGRFEFQQVDDYRAGGTPRARYARRDVCAACHQNLAPIFSRPLWLETNANPRVAALLQRQATSFSGVAVQRGVDIPAAIDAATDRANLFSVWQRLWRDACGANDAAGRRCRGAAVLAALQFRLSEGRGFDESASDWHDHAVPTIARQWRRRWPSGLAIPNPDLPNRDPMPPVVAPLAGAMLANVPARFEPLQPRLPLELWLPSAKGQEADAGTRALARRFAIGLGDFFSAADLHALDRQLHASAGVAATRRMYRGNCTFSRSAVDMHFRCEAPLAPDSVQLSGGVTLRGGRVSGGELHSLALGGGVPMSYLTIESGSLADDRATLLLHEDGQRIRMPDGTAIESIELAWRDAIGAPADIAGHATVSVVDDFAPLRQTLDAWSSDLRAAPLSMQPFDASKLMAELLARLGATRGACCETAGAWPEPSVEPPLPATPTRGPTRPFAAFYTACASCHATSEPTPPNFLSGDPVRVIANLRHCAPRIYVRLAMWRREAAQREKMPMPPPIAKSYAYTPQPPEQVEALEQAAASLLRAETGRQPEVDALLRNGYESLRSCLPVAGQHKEASS
jgi:hypothetical protein